MGKQARNLKYVPRADTLIQHYLKIIDIMIIHTISSLNIAHGKIFTQIHKIWQILKHHVAHMLGRKCLRQLQQATKSL